MKCSLGRRKARICNHILLLDSDWMNPCWRTGAELLVLARQGRKLAAVPVSMILFARRQSCWKLRLRTIARHWIRIMEADRVMPGRPGPTRAAAGSAQIMAKCLEENTTAGAAKVHQLIREPVGLQAARGNAVDEQLKLRHTLAAVWRAANTVEPALAWPEDDGPLFRRPSVDAMRRVLTSFRAVTGLGYDAVPPRTLNELPDQAIEALTDLTMLIEEKRE